ncbi:MAG: DUF3810 domain-containing protein [Phocaeicola sp.]
MNSIKSTLLKQLPMLFLLAFVVACRYLPHWAEAYMTHLYPITSYGLSAFASLIPYSLEELLAIALLVVAIIYPLVVRNSSIWKHTWRQILTNYTLAFVWIYIWFYLAWGMSYYRLPIYERVGFHRSAYEEQSFKNFLSTYAEGLNKNYMSDWEFDTDELEVEVKELYRKVEKRYGLASPQRFQHPKQLLFNRLYSSVGVLGYMGPFFIETQLNSELLAIQYPFSYAHEYAHLLGVSNEAEANYWAFQICSRSAVQEVRYSAYFGILPYVLNNAAVSLPEAACKEWIGTIRPEILDELRAKNRYWVDQYSPTIGEMQSWVYNLFLRSNKIASGRKNYAEVVGLLIDLEKQSPFLFEQY